MMDGYKAEAGQPSFRVPAGVLHRDVGGQTMLLHLDSEKYFGLDEVGARMLARITEHPWEEAVAVLVSDFNVEPARLVHDLDGLINELLATGLLERIADAA